MSLAKVPAEIRNLYELYEWQHAVSILASDFPKEWKDVVDVLRAFRLKKSQVMAEGGNKSTVSTALDSAFYQKGWEEKKFESHTVVDGESHQNPTHGIDCYKNRIALEVEWSNKDPFYDRDLNNFRILHGIRAISVGVIITKSEKLKDAFKKYGVYQKFGASTTWMSKLLPRVDGGGAGGCPVFVVGIDPRVLLEHD